MLTLDTAIPLVTVSTQYLDWSTTAPARGPNQQFKLMDQNGDPTPQDYSTAKEKEFEVERHALFFTDPDAQKFYMNHVAFMINRTNTINGWVACGWPQRL